jgi:dipeptidyl-peptidase-3
MEKYSERFNDIVILQLDTEGFEKLSEKQKKLAYHLSNAGLWGRRISLDQGSVHNVPFMDALIELYGKVHKTYLLHKQIHESLFILFAHNGIYHSTSGEKLSLPLELDTLMAYSDKEPELINKVKSIWFDGNIPQFRTVQKDGVDVVKESGGNFYHNLTTEEVNKYRQDNYPKVKGDEVPPFGFNERLVKNENGGISREIISEDGLYGPYVKQIIKHLIQALEFTENDQQYYSINTLIDFYKTGDAFDFDKHCVAWAQDRDSHVYFINGLIESYEDPLGIGCTFESVVAFKNPLQTAKVNKIIDNIQWLEDNLPFDKSFKKDKAIGLSASSINVISMAGDTSPSLPLGINLPNSDWIRKKHGSKSVSLANVSSSRSSYEVQIREALFLKKYHSVLETYNHMTNDLHTDLHEIAGHGSGKTLEGVNTDILGAYYSTIEEARADLVALYYMAEPKLKEFGVYDNSVNVEDAALAQYVSYLTHGAIGQLRRVELGNDLTQPHFRNRQLIALWVLEHADKEKVRMIEENGSHYIEIHDIGHVKELFGKLLGKVQTIKSTGDLDAAKELVMTYGTKVNQQIHSELLERMKKLDMPKVVGFITPMLVEKENTIVVEQSNNFFEQQMILHSQFDENSLKKKVKHKM